MKSYRSEREMGRRMKTAGCFPAAGSTHLVQGLLLPWSRRLPEILHQNPIQFPYSFLMSPTLQYENPRLAGRPLLSQSEGSLCPFHSGIPTTHPCHTSGENFLNQPTSYKCTIYARHRCQSGQTAGTGTKAPAGARAAAGIPTSRLGQSWRADLHVQLQKYPLLAYLPCK